MRERVAVNNDWWYFTKCELSTAWEVIQKSIETVLMLVTIFTVDGSKIKAQPVN